MIDQAWLEQLVRDALDEVEEKHRRRREYPGFTQKQIAAGLTGPVLVDPPTLEALP